jgi:thioredoxin reductase (NADPH)
VLESPSTGVDRAAAAAQLVGAGFVHLCVALETAELAWSCARAVFGEAARDDGFAVGMPPLGVVGQFTVPPVGARRRGFQALHFDFGLPVVPAGSRDVARFTALYVDRHRPQTTALTRIVSLRRLLGQRAWVDFELLVDRLRRYGEANAGGDVQDRDGYVEGICARIVEAADGSPTLPRCSDAGFLCGMEFESVGQEQDHLLARGLDLDAVEQRVLLGPGQLLLVDNLATAHGRLGVREPLELQQLCVGFRKLDVPEQSILLRRVLDAFCSAGRRQPGPTVGSTLGVVASSTSPVLSKAQFALLARHGEERTAAVGETLFRIGDLRYPFIAIIAGEAAVLDAAGHEIIRHGASGFLGEMNLMSGQTVFLTAVVTQPMRYIAVDRDVLRPLLFDDGPLSDLLLSTFMARREALQRRQDVGFEIVGPRSSVQTRRIVEFATRNRLPYRWRDSEPASDGDMMAPGGLDEGQWPLVRLPGGPDLRGPSNGELSRALGIGRDLGAHDEVDLLVVGAGPAGLGAAVYGASEGLATLVVESSALGGQAGASRRIENYLGFPAGISGSELTSRAVVQARKFHARIATPYRALALEPGTDGHVVRLEDHHDVAARAVVLATGAAYRRLPVADLEQYEGISIFYAAGPPEAERCGAMRVGVVGGGNSAGQAAVWLARGGALVTLLHRRSDLRETMSDYLVLDLERYGVAVRDRSEVAELHGTDGELDAVTLRDGEQLSFSFLFLFLGAVPCTDWLADTVARDDNGFVLTGSSVGAEGLLETSVPGVYAAGDVRSGSTKRCATAVGEGAMVVRLVHERLSGVAA